MTNEQRLWQALVEACCMISEEDKVTLEGVPLTSVQFAHFLASEHGAKVPSSNETREVTS